jgi:hypothetical protein
MSAHALAAFFTGVSPRLLHELAEAGVLGSVSEAAAELEWQAVALHAVIRGVVAEDDRSDAQAELIDALHEIVVPALAAPGREAAAARPPRPPLRRIRWPRAHARAEGRRRACRRRS